MSMKITVPSLLIMIGLSITKVFILYLPISPLYHNYSSNTL